jgi:SAM-dependent methyltransferase
MTSLGQQGESNEVRRIRAVYAERERRSAVRRETDNTSHGNSYLVRDYRDRLVRLLRDRFEKPLIESRILDVGCGHGSLLGWFHEQGVRAENLFGVDLLASRIAIARARYPSFNFQEANAEQLCFPGGFFDLVAVFTVFSSVLDRQMADNLARSIGRVLSPGGAVVWYDVRYPNPWNPHLRGMTKRRIHEIFPRFIIDLEPVSLFPPLTRHLGPFIDMAYPLLATVSGLRTHYLGLLRSPPA